MIDIGGTRMVRRSISIESRFVFPGPMRHFNFSGASTGEDWLVTSASKIHICGFRSVGCGDLERKR